MNGHDVEVLINGELVTVARNVEEDEDSHDEPPLTYPESPNQSAEISSQDEYTPTSNSDNETNPFSNTKPNPNPSFIHSYIKRSEERESGLLDFEIPAPVFSDEDEEEEEYIYNFSPRVISQAEREKIDADCERKPVVVLQDPREEMFSKCFGKKSKSRKKRPPKVSEERRQSEDQTPLLSSLPSTNDRVPQIIPVVSALIAPALAVIPSRNQSIFSGMMRNKRELAAAETKSEASEATSEILEPERAPSFQEKRTSLLKQRMSSHKTDDIDKHQRQYHHAIFEFLDKVEATIQVLEELDNFYSKLGNRDSFKHIIDSWPQIHRTSLPQIISVHHRFIAKSGATGNDHFTNQTNRK